MRDAGWVESRRLQVGGLGFCGWFGIFDLAYGLGVLSVECRGEKKKLVTMSYYGLLTVTMGYYGLPGW